MEELSVGILSATDMGLLLQQRRNLPSVCSVDPDFVDLSWVLAQVLDMAEDVAVGVLAKEVSKVGAQA